MVKQAVPSQEMVESNSNECATSLELQRRQRGWIGAQMGSLFRSECYGEPP